LVLGPRVLPSDPADLLRGDRVHVAQVVVEITPPGLHLECRQGPGNAFVAAQPIDEVAPVELFQPLEFLRGDQLRLELFQLRKQNPLQRLARRKIGRPFFDFGNPRPLQCLGLVGGAAQNEHAGVAVVWVSRPGLDRQTLLDDVLSHPRAAPLAQDHGERIQREKVGRVDARPVEADAHDGGARALKKTHALARPLLGRLRRDRLGGALPGRIAFEVNFSQTPGFGQRDIACQNADGIRRVVVF